MAKKNELLDREFTGEEDYKAPAGERATAETKQEELKPFAEHIITYQVGGFEPEIREFSEEFRPNPSNEEVLDALMIKKPYLNRLLITILKINRIAK